ncbi:hypothetical protein, partial [Candidatus Anaplasma sp. TIGMIC]|uniref:hypothetical protein n=1 Tax=Candidatus Anaplasma sp. TIGMIC TaxID=3020713 RepID=UPI00232E1947
MYNLSIEVDNQNVSSGNVEVEGTDFYGCGCRANGQCAEVLGYWENDVLTVLLSDEGCGSSAGQILNEGGIYDFEEVGSGSLNGTNSFGVSGNEVQAYAAYLLHEGDDVTISDRQSINATVRFVPVVEEIVPEDQGTDLVAAEEEGLPKDGAEQEEVSAVQGPGLEPEEEAEAKVQVGADRGDEDDDAAVDGENVDVSQVGQPEVSGPGAEEVLEVPAGRDSVDAEDKGDRADQEQLGLVSQDESLGN